MTITRTRVRSRRMIAALSAAITATALLPVNAASAAIPTRIDVGYTITDHVYWKGSGSYSNGNGTYVRWCVRLMMAEIGPNRTLSSRCQATPAGSQGTMSAPDVRCYRSGNPTDYVYTRVSAYDANNRETFKESNDIDPWC
ncbi:hypothetical protein AB0G15_19235 [Streptosporangium sp. NPDC023825]|uniref:hypothetical protein n=1 Tax=Streptosporangium sp. NPDC023825 TaxID=3154909 RepID=UPI00341D51C9